MRKAIPYILLIFNMLFWAANFYAVQIALDYYEPFSVATWRFMFGLVTLVILAYVQFRLKIFKLRFSRREWWYMFLTGFFGIFLTIYFFNSGLQSTSPINGSLIIATSPAITAVLSFLLLNKRISAIQWFSIFLSFLGVVVILVKGDLHLLFKMGFESGDLYILAMALVFSISQLIVSKYLPHIDATILTMISTSFALILFIVFSIPELRNTPIPLEFDFWASIIYMGILGTGVAYTVFYYCVVKVGATTSALFMNLIPFFAVLLAFPFGEQILWSQLVGGSIIITGLYLFNRYK